MRCLSVSTVTKLIGTVWRVVNCTRLDSNVIFRRALMTTTITVLLGCLMYFINSRNDGTSRNLFFRSQHLTHKDTLREMVSAGFKCRQMSAVITTSGGGRVGLSNSSSPSQNNQDQSSFLVPNVVHYVWLGSDLNFTFLHYLSFLSVHHFIVPSYIFVHGETEPAGYWWNRTIHQVDNVFHVSHAPRTLAPSGTPFNYKAHASDVIRMEIILSKYDVKGDSIF